MENDGNPADFQTWVGKKRKNEVEGKIVKFNPLNTIMPFLYVEGMKSPKGKKEKG